MQPSVSLPPGLIARPIDFKLKPGWHYETAQGVFVGPRGVRFALQDLPASARVEHKVSIPKRTAARQWSKAERELQRHMHVVLPPEHKPEEYVADVQRWPCVEEAHLAPEPSLPTAIAPARRARR